MAKENVKVKAAHTDDQTKTFRTPDGYTSDILLFTVKKVDDCPKLHILLIKRASKNAEGKVNVEGDKWAIPGGFVNEDEDAYTAGVRELEEETGVKDIPLTAFGVYDKPGRDPRGWIISRAHYAFVPLESLENRIAGDDAAAVELIPVETALTLSLAFDHFDMLTDALCKITSEMLLSTKVSEFLPEQFTIEELYQMLLGCTAENTLPAIEEFRQVAVLLPFLQLVSNDKYRFSAEANAQSIFF